MSKKKLSQEFKDMLFITVALAILLTILIIGYLQQGGVN